MTRHPMTRAKVSALVVAMLLLGGGIGSVVQRQFGSSTDAVDEKPTAVDVGFLRDMMLHHEQAIQLSLLQLDRGVTRDIRQEAVDILLAQRGEYVQMGDQLDEWGVDPVNPDETVMGWMGMSMPAASMPGLASPSDIMRLKASDGKAADAVFLQLMVTHHVGGVDMANFAKREGASQLVVEMATRMSALQSQEILEMQGMAQRLGVVVDLTLPAHNMPAHNMPADGEEHEGEEHTQTGNDSTAHH